MACGHSEFCIAQVDQGPVETSPVTVMQLNTHPRIVIAELCPSEFWTLLNRA